MIAHETGDRVEPIAVGQHDIGHQHIGQPAIGRAPHLGKRAGGNDIMPGPIERARDDGADRRIVVDDEHGRGHAAAPRARRILRTVASGLPSRAYWTIPPIARTSLSTRASPSPFPSGRPETNGSNSNSAISEGAQGRSEEHTSELQSLMRIPYAVFCL